jgi:branched-chain amino acid transport system substrate-binding protein
VVKARGGHIGPIPIRYPVVLAGVAATALLLAACSSSASSTSSGSTSSPSSSQSATAAAASALGTPDAATGSAVSVGVIVDGGGANAIGTAALVQQGAQMAVAYANAYKGGLDGHKINLVVCQNQETPADGQACANQLVQDKVVAVVVPFTGQGATEVPTITKAGIPYITLSGASNQELMTPGAYDLTGGYPATLGAYALSAKSHGYSKFAMLVSNVPAAIQGAELLGSLVFKNAGIGYKVIPVNSGTADVTPQLQAAVSWGAKAIGLTGDVTLCSSFLKGYQTLGLTEPKYVISTCLDPSIFSTLGTQLGGSYMDTTSNATSAEDALYAAITQKFAPAVNGNPNASAGQASGLIPVFSLLDIMSGYTGAVTPAAVKAQLAMSTTRTVPLSGGITYLCNGKAIPLLPSVCSAASAVGTLSSTGAVSGLQNYNPSPLFKE